ncbi:hypothetical protein DPMN_032827 [Dreissena polymorpha]|uniref:Uncharacterized protein n=1 Tax=Dreissena polymorpha TaxID=45954 RepID=A0A9D4RKG4_DREPO|nr:hypothetical protein DPMN_032826 [Dreissena polymorpha]KAH3869657.1 hypothetical protein DPMN_032827 [Dreissena polymorpha]
MYSVSSWSELVATETRSRLQKIDISRLDLLRMAQQIQLSPSPSSRTSSSLLRLLSSPGCSGSPNRLFIVESLSARTGPEVPSVEGRVRRDSKTTSGRTYGTDSGFLHYGREPLNIDGVALKRDPGKRYLVRSTCWVNRLGDEDDSR